MDVRRPDLAGSWYPGSPAQCLRALEAFSREAPSFVPRGEPVGGIVPHAGWSYSGKAAFAVYRCLAQQGPPDTLLLFGRHMHPSSPNVLMARGAWVTPLGDLAIDEALAGRLAEDFPFEIETARAHEPDNTLELQLPMIKYFFPEVRIVPLGLPPAGGSLPIAKAAVRYALDMGRRTWVIGSTDLTHYGHAYGFAPRGTGEKAVAWVKETHDRRVIDKILGMDAEGVLRESLEHQNACCGGAAASAIVAARELGASQGEEILHYTSHDVRPNSDFVGYAGIVFSGPRGDA